MDYKDTKIWKKFIEKCKNEKEKIEVEELCEQAIEMMKLARDTFPRYTLHDERHLFNVLNIMGQLLEGYEDNLTASECEMLILAAFYHDVGMCYTEEQKQEKLRGYQFEQYLNSNPDKYLKVTEKSDVPIEIQLDFFRKIHHTRVTELIPEMETDIQIRRDYLVKICKSHGEDRRVIEELEYDSHYEVDCKLCAVLLRIADILDFDITRTPKVLYEIQKIELSGDEAAVNEWKKHMASRGIKINVEEDKISFSAVSENMQIEHIIEEFLDYIEEEIEGCKKILLQHASGRWKEFLLPAKIERNIERRGYRTGEYCITLDAQRTIQLLVGNDLYMESSVFVRELLQNALDSVRARKMLDHEWNHEQAEIILDTWYDAQNNQWYQISDCGIGMSEETIKNYLLKIGRSYYQSDEFKMKRYKHKNDSFRPISKFGIGILSCFLQGDRLDISTRHYETGHGIRFCMTGLEGYYTVSEEEAGDRGSAMPGSEESKWVYRQNVGTTIAVRLRDSIPKSLEDILLKYVCFPDITVTYKKNETCQHMFTKQELFQFVNRNPQIELPLSEEMIQKTQVDIPLLKWKTTPRIVIGCTNLNQLIHLDNDNISGVDFRVEFGGEHNIYAKRKIMDVNITRDLEIRFEIQRDKIDIILSISCDFRSTEESSLDELYERYKNSRVEIREVAEQIENGETDYINCEDEITQNILFLLNSLKMKNEYSKLQMPLCKNLEANTLLNKIIFPRCGNNKSKLENGKTEIAFDGIRVQTGYDTAYEGNSYFRYTVILLSGEYQPTLSLNREYITDMPIEAAGYLETIGYKIRNHAIAGKCLRYKEMILKDYENIYYEKNLWKTIEKTKIISYNPQMTIQQLKECLEKEEKIYGIRLEGFSNLVANFYYEYQFEFLMMLTRIILQKEFEIRWYWNSNRCREYVVTGIRKTEVVEEEVYFPPLMFVKAIDNDSTILTERSGEWRESFNADHPFSKWLLENAAFLYKKKKSILQRITTELCTDYYDEMIDEVNSLLKELEISARISIPKEVFLKEDDFVGIDLTLR